MTEQKYCYLILVCSLLLIGACDSTSKPKNRGSDVYKSYLLITTYKTPDLLRADTARVLAKDDSSAYLNAKEDFGGHGNDWQLAKKLGFEEPVSFVVLDANSRNILDNLSKSAIHQIDSIARIRVEEKKYIKYDSNGNIRLIDSQQNGLLKHIESKVKDKNNGS